MADSASPTNHDAHYLAVTARLYGWRAAQRPHGPLELERPGWSVTVSFTSGGQFGHATAHGPGRRRDALTMRELLDLLENNGTPDRSA